jgi:uncharacterized membrane protein HdeD (DUF308 family)
MGDEHSEQNKPLWRQQAGNLLGVLAGLFIGQCIHNWHAFHDQGFNPFRWDNFLAGAVGAVAGLWLVGQRKNEQITTLGIGEATAKKLR